MTRPVIELEGVGKRYRLGEHLGGATDLREMLTERLRGSGKSSKPNSTEFWALRDVNLSVAEGESLGIVGKNGAGKSTFLKVVAGVTTPTVGVSRTRGRIGSLLEVGTGFDDELTGRENMYLSGAILGMRQADVRRQLDQITEFAGLDGFMDTPVKRYSSGMYLRLAFAVAAHLDADILLVDEVLAVGDADFRRKCLAKMSEVEASGRTVLFASHNLEALTEFCSKVVWIDGGRVAALGAADTTVRQYLTSTAPLGEKVEISEFDGSAQATLRSVAVLDCDMQVRSTIGMGEEVVIELEVDVNQTPPGVDIGIVVARSNGTVLLDENLSEGHPALQRTGRHKIRLLLPPVLTPAEYAISVWLGTAYEDISFDERVVSFAIEGTDSEHSDRLIRLGAPWTTDWMDPRPA